MCPDRKQFGNAGLSLSLAIALALYGISFLLAPAPEITESFGIVLPSPEVWPILPLWSAAADVVLLLACAFGLYFLNKHFDFVKTTDKIIMAAILVMTASSPELTNRLNSSTIICAVNLVACALAFDTYKKANATQEMFVIATLLSVGSLIEYAFVPYILVYILAMPLMKVFRIKETIAFFMGLVAPYWIGIGSTLLPLGSFRFQPPEFLFTSSGISVDDFVLLLTLGLTALWMFMAGVNVIMKLYAGNARVLAMNNIMVLLGVVSAAGILLDAGNMLSYCATFYMSAAVVLADVFALWPMRKSWIPLSVMALLYVASFIVSMVL